MRLIPKTKPVTNRGKFFEPENLTWAEDNLYSWAAMFPEAAADLQRLWRDHLPKAGHKFQGRVILTFEFAE